VLTDEFRNKAFTYSRSSSFTLSSFSGVEWNRVHYNSSHLLAYCTIPGWWWMMVSVEQLVEWLTWETEVLGEYLSQCRFVYHKSHMTWAGAPRWETSDYPPELRYAITLSLLFIASYTNIGDNQVTKSKGISISISKHHVRRDCGTSILVLIDFDSPRRLTEVLNLRM
jgi:hypothetical protein